MSAEYGFKEFADQPFYRAANIRLIELAGLRPGQHIVELACGTGAVTKLIIDRIKGARDSLVVGIDYSSAAIKEATRQLSGIRDAVVQLVERRAEEFTQVVREKVDAVVFCNGIHYIPNKDQLLAEISKGLKQGGIFAFNSSFYQGAHPQETEGFYRKWMMRAIRITRRDYGLTPSQDKVESRKQLTPEQYEALLSAHGLKVAKQEVNTQPVTLQGWLDISHFADFVEGALPGIPVDKASAALQQAVREIFEEMKLEFVPRNWLSVVAVKP